MNELVFKPAARQLERLRSNEVSVLELAEAHIQQIERLNPELNAFADFGRRELTFKAANARYAAR